MKGKITFFDKWWMPFLGIPSISLLTFILLYGGLYPLLTYDSWLIQLNSQFAIKLIAAIASFLIPLIYAKIFQESVIVPIIIWSMLSALGLFTEPGNYEGNQNLGLVGYFFGFQVAAILITMGFSAYQRRRKSLFQSSY